jgi:hypothetical protein
MVNLKKVGLLSSAVLAAQVILTKLLYPLIGKNTQTMFSIEPTTGIGGSQVGNVILGYLTGYLPFDMKNIWIWLAMSIGVFLMVFAGFWIYEQKYLKLWQGKNLTQRIFFILLYGHLGLYLVLLLMKWNVPGIALNLLIGLVINLALVAVLVTLSAEKLKYPRI